MASPPPSGRQYVIRHGRQEAVITEVGAGLRAYTVSGVEILDGYAENEMCTVARGAPLIPWPNRLADGKYEFMGTRYQTAITEPAQHNAIHGLIRWMNWAGAIDPEDRVLMSLLLHPQEGYPFTLDLAIEYTLGDEGLTVRTTATNAGDRPLPYGAGAHPYLSLGTDRIDTLTMRLPALLSIDVDERQIPTGRLSQVKDSEFDFLEPRRIGATRIDTAFTSLLPDAGGLTRVLAASEETRRQTTLWMDHAYGYVMVFTGDTIPDASRRRKGLGLEPMTCAPNAFQSGLGLIRLEPGQSVTSAWGIFAVV